MSYQQRVTLCLVDFREHNGLCFWLMSRMKEMMKEYKSWTVRKYQILDQLKSNCSLFLEIDKSFQQDKDIAVLAISLSSRNYDILKDTPLSKDRDIILQMSKHSPVWQGVFTDWTDDEEIMLNLMHSADRFYMVSPRLKQKKDFVIKCIEYSNSSIFMSASAFHDDKDVAMIAVAKSGNVLSYCSDRLKKDSGLVLVAVTQNGTVLEYVPPILRRESSIYITAVENCGVALEFVDDDLKTFDLVMTAVKLDGLALKYAPDHLKENEMIITSALQSTTEAFQLLSHDLQLVYAEKRGDELFSYRYSPTAKTVFGYLMIKGYPCKIINVSHSKSGKGGRRKSHLVGRDLVTLKKYEMIIPWRTNVECPFVWKYEYTFKAIEDNEVVLISLETGEEVRKPMAILSEADDFELVEGKQVTLVKTLGKERIKNAQQ